MQKFCMYFFDMLIFCIITETVFHDFVSCMHSWTGKSYRFLICFKLVAYRLESGGLVPLAGVILMIRLATDKILICNYL